jgi:transposase-like protein
VTAWRRVQRSIAVQVRPGVLIVRSRLHTIEALLLDAKHLSIRGEPYTLYVAFDGVQKKPLCWILLSRYERREGYDRILKHLKEKNINVSGVVSDWHRGILASLADYYPKAIHQRCAVHVVQEVMRRLGGQRFFNSLGGKMIWPHIVKIALRYTSLHAAKSRLGSIRRQYPSYDKAWKTLAEALLDIYQFTKDTTHVLPRHSNLIENFMGQIAQRLKTMRGMKSPEATIKIITALIMLKQKRSTNK